MFALFTTTMVLGRFLAIVVAIASLSICHAQPKEALRAILDGNTGLFNSTGHPKSKGAAFTMKYPKNWEEREGNRPNVVKKIEYPDEKGLVTVTISTKSIPGDKITRKEAEDFFSSSEMKFGLPDEAIFLSATSTKIEDEPAGIIEFTTLTARAGVMVKMHVVSLNFFQGNTLVQVLFTVASIESEASGLSARAAAWKPVFQSMMNTIVFPNKWR